MAQLSSSTRTSAASWSSWACRMSKGYKPRGNYQGLLATEVESFLDQRPGFLEQFAASPHPQPERNPHQPPRRTSMRSSSIHQRRSSLPVARTSRGYPEKAQRIDFAEKDAANRRLASSERSSFTTWNDIVSSTPGGTTWH